jgi:hypothetical protein
MKKRLKEAWVKGLRSGKYKQAHGTLHKSDEDYKHPSYCCLGVLCQIKKGVTLEKDIYYYKDVGMEGMLSENKDFMEAIGMDNITETTLIGFNDTQKWSFKQIARWIERNL